MREDESGYEIHNPAIKEVLRGTAKRIGGALPEGWGFLLMLFDYSIAVQPGSTFYISNGDRPGCIKLLRDWLLRQGDDGVVNVSSAAGRRASEQMLGEWHKVAALLMLKLGTRSVEFTVADVEQLAAIQDSSVVFGANDDPNVLQIRLVSGEEARQITLAKEAKRGQR